MHNMTLFYKNGFRIMQLKMAWQKLLQKKNLSDDNGENKKHVQCQGWRLKQCQVRAPFSFPTSNKLHVNANCTRTLSNHGYFRKQEHM